MGMLRNDANAIFYCSDHVSQFDIIKDLIKSTCDCILKTDVRN